jgi:hypothetical protein
LDELEYFRYEASEKERKMITKLIRVTILVRDQDEALRWYPEKLGFEKKADDCTQESEGGGNRSSKTGRRVARKRFCKEAS